MGRNSKEEDNVHHYLESPRSPGSHVIPRRFPRLGSQFQTRIPKSTDPLERPTPALMSTEVPYATKEDVTIYKNDNNHWLNGRCLWPVSTHSEASCCFVQYVSTAQFVRVSFEFS